MGETRTNSSDKAHSNSEVYGSICTSTDDEFSFNRNEVLAYIKKKENENQPVTNPEVKYLSETVFPLLKTALVDMLIKMKSDNSLYQQNSTLNGLDYLSEYLYNKNPKYPERELKWTYIFDMKWVEQYLKINPRPYYPFHLIWSKHFAALKIQSYMRGYWVRCRHEVQDLRQFWKTYKEGAV